jgi:hypothetical protein
LRKLDSFSAPGAAGKIDAAQRLCSGCYYQGPITKAAKVRRPRMTGALFLPTTASINTAIQWPTNPSPAGTDASLKVLAPNLQSRAPPAIETLRYPPLWFACALDQLTVDVLDPDLPRNRGSFGPPRNGILLCHSPCDCRVLHARPWPNFVGFCACPAREPPTRLGTSHCGCQIASPNPVWAIRTQSLLRWLPALGPCKTTFGWA